MNNFTANFMIFHPTKTTIIAIRKISHSGMNMMKKAFTFIKEYRKILIKSAPAGIRTRVAGYL